MLSYDIATWTSMELMTLDNDKVIEDNLKEDALMDGFTSGGNINLFFGMCNVFIELKSKYFCLIGVVYVNITLYRVDIRFFRTLN